MQEGMRARGQLGGFESRETFYEERSGESGYSEDDAAPQIPEVSAIYSFWESICPAPHWQYRC
jgi:hypothetical protein